MHMQICTHDDPGHSWSSFALSKQHSASCRFQQIATITLAIILICILILLNIIIINQNQPWSGPGPGSPPPPPPPLSSLSWSSCIKLRTTQQSTRTLQRSDPLFTDPQTWVSNSSIATYWTGSVGIRSHLTLDGQMKFRCQVSPRTFAAKRIVRTPAGNSRAPHRDQYGWITS